MGVLSFDMTFMLNFLAYIFYCLLQREQAFILLLLFLGFFFFFGL